MEIQKLWTLFLLIGGCLLPSFTPAAEKAEATGGGAAPVVGKPAPAFRLPEVTGKMRTLGEFRGRPVALFFFCGCSECAEVGKEWAQLQRSGALSAPLPAAPRETDAKSPAPPRSAAGPLTIIVYTEMEAEAARQLAAQCALAPKETVLLLDRQLAVAKRLYHAEPCPHVFILDPQGVLCHTGAYRKEDDPEAPAAAMVSLALARLRRCRET